MIKLNVLPKKSGEMPFLFAVYNEVYQSYSLSVIFLRLSNRFESCLIFVAKWSALAGFG